MTIPDDVTTLLRDAAGAAPPHPGDLARVRRRGRARIRHRTMAATGSVALAVAAALAAPFALTGPDPAGELAPPATSGSAGPAGPTAPAPLAEPAQRLLLSGSDQVLERQIDGDGDGAGPPPGLTARERYEWYRDRPDASGVIGPLAELRPDGTVVALPDLPGIDAVRELVAMPDGRVAVLGLVDLMPGVERTDGPCVAGIAFPLLVVERDGSVGEPRDLRVRCETLRLVAADAGTSYLLRDDRLVAHDLATGDERLLLDGATTQGSGIDHAGGQLAVVTHDDEPACGPGTIGRLVLRVTEVATGTTTDHRLPVDGCDGYGGMLRLSPDGRYAAVGYHTFADEPSGGQQARMAVLDLDRGTLVEDRLVVESTGPDETANTGSGGLAIWGDAVTGGIAGLAWDDPQTVRIAWYEVSMAGVHWLPDVVEMTTVPVPR